MWQVEWKVHFNKPVCCFSAVWLTNFWAELTPNDLCYFGVRTWTAEQTNKQTKISYFCKFTNTYLCLVLKWERSMIRTYSGFPHNALMNVSKYKLSSNDCTVSCEWLHVKETQCRRGSGNGQSNHTKTSLMMFSLFYYPLRKMYYLRNIYC